MNESKISLKSKKAKSGSKDLFFCFASWEPHWNPQDSVFFPAVEKATLTRQQQYVAVRMCAESILQGFESSGRWLFELNDRAPEFPQGFCGSFAHTGSRAVALIGSSTDFQALGVDQETVMPLDRWEKVRSKIVSDREQRLLEASLGSLTENQKGTLVFSAKESIYKALYPQEKKFFGFLDAQLIQIDEEKGILKFALETTLSPSWSQGKQLEISFLKCDDVVTTYLCVGQ